MTAPDGHPPEARQRSEQPPGEQPPGEQGGEDQRREQLEVPPNPIRRSDVLSAELDGDTVLYDPSAHQLVVLNRSAALVWGCCDGSGSPEEIAADIAEVFAVDESSVRLQVLDLVEEWSRRGLLEAVPGIADGA